MADARSEVPIPDAASGAVATRHASMLEDGILAGIIGAIIVAVWFLVLDLSRAADPRLRETRSQRLQRDRHHARHHHDLLGCDALLLGDDFFAESEREVGVQLATLGSLGERPFEALGLSASYVFADRYDALALRLRWRF